MCASLSLRLSDWFCGSEVIMLHCRASWLAMSVGTFSFRPSNSNTIIYNLNTIEQ